MTSKEWEARLDGYEPKCATDRPAPGWMPMARHMLFDLADREATLFSAQQALLTEGRARNAAEESYQHLTAALAHTVEERDTLAAQLAECRAELADYRAWYECRVHPESPMVCGDILHLESRIEARRAKEAER